MSLLGYTRARPRAVFAAIWQFAELHPHIHRCRAPPGSSRCEGGSQRGSRCPIRRGRTSGPTATASPNYLDVLLDAYREAAPWSPGQMHFMWKCLPPPIHRSYLERDFRLHPGTPRQVEAWQAPLAIATRSRHIPATATEETPWDSPSMR